MTTKSKTKPATKINGKPATDKSVVAHNVAINAKAAATAAPAKPASKLMQLATQIANSDGMDIPACLDRSKNGLKALPPGPSAEPVVTVPAVVKTAPPALLAIKPVKELKPGMKVRVLFDEHFEKTDKPSRRVFTVLPFDPGEPKPGPGWYPIDDYLLAVRWPSHPFSNPTGDHDHAYDQSR